jgi:Spy/CpxP family protein refolding chaperone
MVKEVGLTPEQVSKIDKIYERRNKQIATQIEEYNKQHDELDRLVRERIVTPETVELQAQRMMPFRVAIDVSRIKMLYEMSRVMSTEQNDRFHAMFDRMGSDRDRGRGRGNPPRH